MLNPYVLAVDTVPFCTTFTFPLYS